MFYWNFGHLLIASFGLLYPPIRHFSLHFSVNVFITQSMLDIIFVVVLCDQWVVLWLGARMSVFGANISRSKPVGKRCDTSHLSLVVRRFWLMACVLVITPPPRILFHRLDYQSFFTFSGFVEQFKWDHFFLSSSLLDSRFSDHTKELACFSIINEW
jgi:hypothetical protein